MTVVPRKIRYFTKRIARSRKNLFEQSHRQNQFNPMKEKEDIDKTLENNMVVAIIFGFESRLWKGKVLAPLTFFVLGNLLVRFVIEC